MNVNSACGSMHELQSKRQRLDTISESFLSIEREQCNKLETLNFGDRVAYVYNPLEYAKETHEDYVRKYCKECKTVMFLGMNPGPFGMAQTGVPFGEVNYVKNWLNVKGSIGKPSNEHPQRLIHGYDCKRSETGKNITPPGLPADCRNELNKICDESLHKVIELLKVKFIVGVGKFAEMRTKNVLESCGNSDVQVFSILHPSPVNPAANKGWKEVVYKQLEEANILKYLKPCDYTF